jgi:HK97 family phage major capsid protein
MTISELKHKRAKLLTDMQALAQKGFNDTSRSAFDKMDRELNEVEADITREERVAAIDAEIRDNRSFQRSPRPGSDSSGNGSGSVEERKAQLNKAFRSYMKDGSVAPEYRDLLTTGAAGALVPQEFYDSLIVAEKYYGPIAQAVKIKVTDGTGRPMKVAKADDTGNGITLLGTEGTSSPAETDPAFTNLMIGTDTVTTGLIKISFEEYADSEFSLDTLIRDFFGVRYARGLERAITLGVDGSGTVLPNMPAGGIAAAATVAVTTAGLANGISYDNLAAVYGALDTAYVQNASWTFHPTTRSYLLGLLDGFGRPLFQPNPTTAEPFGYLIGAPVILNSSMPQMGANAQPIILSDFSRTFLLRKDGPMSILKLSERYADLLEYGYYGYSRIAGAIIAPTSVTAIASLKQAAS